MKKGKQAQYASKIDGEEKVSLRDFDPGYVARDVTKEEAAIRLKELDVELNELQEMLSVDLLTDTTFRAY